MDPFSLYYTVKNIGPGLERLEQFWGFWLLIRVTILVFRTISQQLHAKTKIGPGLEQFKQIRTNLRFLGFS